MVSARPVNSLANIAPCYDQLPALFAPFTKPNLRNYLQVQSVTLLFFLFFRVCEIANLHPGVKRSPERPLNPLGSTGLKFRG